MPPLAKSLHVVQAAVQERMAARVAELAALAAVPNRPTAPGAHPADSPRRQAVLDLSPVSTAMRGLAQDAAGMYQAQARRSVATA
jgi:hypothetical protein